MLSPDTELPVLCVTSCGDLILIHHIDGTEAYDVEDLKLPKCNYGWYPLPTLTPIATYSDIKQQFPEGFI